MEMCIRDRKVIAQYGDIYPELEQNRGKIIDEINLEESRFQKTLKQGIKEFEKLVKFLPDKTLSLIHIYVYKRQPLRTGVFTDAAR